MESKTNYTLVGVLVLVFTAAAIVTGLWLSVGFDKKVYKTYATHMNESVLGLSVQAPVKFSGVSVGYVKHIAINQADPQQVILLLNVEQGTPITTSTTAVLQSQGITGIRYVELNTDSRYGEPLKKLAGETYPIIPSKPSLLVQLDAALKDVTENFQQITDAMGSVLDKENALAIKNSFRNIETVTAVLSNQAKYLSSSIKNADVLFKNAAQASKSLPRAITNISESAQAVKEMSQTARVAGHKISSTMDYSKQAVKEISEQTMPQITALVEKLENIAKNVNGLTKELKRNPSMLIRGKKARPLGPGERN